MTITGVRLTEIVVRPRHVDEAQRLCGEFTLSNISGTVVARQQIGGYSGIKLPLSAATYDAWVRFERGVEQDLEAYLGFCAEDKVLAQLMKGPAPESLPGAGRAAGRALDETGLDRQA
jgi:hypothetical protein